MLIPATSSHMFGLITRDDIGMILLKNKYNDITE